jgi:soluble lytic murein transglycosylase-like protein
MVAFSSNGICGLKDSIRKYLHTTIPEESLVKISQYDALIEYYSRLNYFQPHIKINPDFIRALILAESSGNPKAVSVKNAIGLSQILYSTGKQAAAELAHSDFRFKYVDRYRLSNLRRKDLFDPKINILLTCYLISQYIMKYNGKLELVLSAWNAGDNTKSLDFDKPAPYQETYDLIGKVNGYFIFFLDNY